MKRENLIQLLLLIGSIFFTGYGVYLLLVEGDLTNGLLSMILGEAIDLPKRDFP